MRFFADPQNLILILVAFVSGAMLVWPLVRRGVASTGAASTAEAVRLINRERGILIDVSEPAEYAAGHAAGARSVPFGQLEGSKDLPSNKTLPLLVMCPTGARAGRAAALLRKAGHERALAVHGGTAAWREAQLPVERSTPADGGKAAVGKGSDKVSDKGGGKPGAKPSEEATEKSV